MKNNQSLENHILLTTKTCTNCREEKDLDEFRNYRRGTGGKMCYCITCQDAINRAQYLKTRDKKISQAREWNEKNRDKTLKYKRKTYRKNKKKD